LFKVDLQNEVNFKKNKVVAKSVIVVLGGAYRQLRYMANNNLKI
jgi:hypothetical protein